MSHVAGAQTLQLRDNYRSTPQVLRGAEGVLQNLVSSGAAPDRVELNPLLADGQQIQVLDPHAASIPGALAPCTWPPPYILSIASLHAQQRCSA